jgi:predicted dehydrogenase
MSKMSKTIKTFGKQIAGYVLRSIAARRAQEVVESRLRNTRELPTVKVAVIGAGRFATCHLEVLSAMGNVDLIGISNRGSSDLSDLATRFSIKNTFSDFRRMLDLTKPEAVFVLVSHFETAAVAAQCLDRGIPCFIEKPAAFTSVETENLARLAAARNCLNMVGLNRRYLSSIHEALAVVLQHGEMTGICIDAPEAIRRLRSKNDHSPELYDHWMVANSIHAIDLFRCLGGEVVGFDGLADHREEIRGDSFAAIMRLSKGCIGAFTAHWLSVPGWSLTLYGESVKAVLSIDTRGEILFSSGARRPVAVDPIDMRFKPGLFAQDEAFISAVALREPLGYPACDLADAVGTMRLIEAISSAQ